MSDIFREVEEDVRRERLEQFWKRYGNYMIALAVVALLAVGGFEIWRRHEAQEREKTSAAFIAAQRITDPRQAGTLFADLAKQSKGGYGLLARMSQANAMYLSGQIGPAVDIYKELAQTDKGPIGAVARLRAAWALANSASRDTLTTLLAPLDDPASAWRQMAREVLAFADYRAAKIKQAQTEYQALADDAQAPDALRSRARAMASFLATGAGGDFGSVPPEAAPPAAAPK